MLSDERKRRIYDTHGEDGIRASQQQQQQQQGGADWGRPNPQQNEFNDVFEVEVGPREAPS